MKNSKGEEVKTRWIKLVIFSGTKDIEINKENPKPKPEVEIITNREIAKIVKAGGKIVSIDTHNYGISPIRIVFVIIYEREYPLDAEDILNEEDCPANT